MCSQSHRSTVEAPRTVRARGPVGIQVLDVAVDLAPGRHVLHADGPVEITGKPWHNGSGWVVSVEFTRTRVLRAIALDELFLGI